ncbi:hypothetical protein IWX49DRAFT_561584 [Phyllosticta citricarpa]|uniref:Required for respiratory growth protein 9, mitochondrial n=2 Tax=Phyllosticta TaxID=121621 RepID=A0ABR1MML6_9PEZI
MACAASSRRILSTSVQSLPGFSTRARVPLRFAPPQAQRNWIRSPAPFSTQHVLRAATDADSGAISDASPTRDTEPNHENEPSLPTTPEPDAEPTLEEIREDLELSHGGSFVDDKLFKLTGRRPGSTQVREPEVQPQIVEDAHHKREDIIAKLVMGTISEEDAKAQLQPLEMQLHMARKPLVPKEKREKVKEPTPVKSAKSRGGNTQNKGKAGDKLAWNQREEDTKPDWKVQKDALNRKFEGASWRPAKRVSPDAVIGIRELHKTDPQAFNTSVLANRFKISSEAVRRILKSKFQPSDEEMADKRERWERRGERVWKKLSDTGVRPPKKWREMGVSHGPAPWKKGKSGRRPKEAGYVWDEDASDRPKGSSFVGRIE